MTHLVSIANKNAPSDEKVLLQNRVESRILMVRGNWQADLVTPEEIYGTNRVRPNPWP